MALVLLVLLVWEGKGGGGSLPGYLGYLRYRYPELWDFHFQRVRLVLSLVLGRDIHALVSASHVYVCLMMMMMECMHA